MRQRQIASAADAYGRCSRVLPDFEIVNFRTFRRLRVERLATVNLIVGKNGVGKTTLLEALRFYGTGSPIALRECLVSHGEWAATGIAGEAMVDLRALFHGRDAKPADVEIGPLRDQNSRLRIRLIDVERVEESDGSYHYEEAEEQVGTGAGGEIVEGVVVQYKNRRMLVPPEVSRRGQVRGKYVGPAFVPAGDVQEADLTYWWEKIALTRSQDRVLEFLSMLEPIVGVTTVDNPSVTGSRMFKVRSRGHDSPVPLNSLGGGLVRIFQLAVALEYSYLAGDHRPIFFPGTDDSAEREPHRLLLIDEIENGIHHTILSELWRAVFRLVRANDVQVFAATHSLDCLRGFARAVAESEDNDGLAIRLENVEGEDQTGAVIIDREGLPIIVRDSIEVR